MKTLYLNAIYSQGLNSFLSLNIDERSLFVLHDFDVQFEMEGGFESYFDNNKLQLETLVQTLIEIEAHEALQILHQLQILVKREVVSEQTANLCQKYYESSLQRWKLLEISFRKRSLSINLEH